MQSQLAAAVLSVGDYELQISLSEALCRLTPRKQRPLKANSWFFNDDISRAFCDIRDRDFEVDCRCFLNFVNSSRGNHRKVFTFPCVSAYLEQRQLFKPKDEKLDQFWIDFNVESECVSFFVDDPQGFLWGSIHLFKDELNHYTLLFKGEGRSLTQTEECTGSEMILSIQLNNPITHNGSKGQRVEITFSSEYEGGLREATEKVFKWGPVPTPTPGWKNRVPSFGRMKSRRKSKLKVLPLSSPSSEDDSTVLLKISRKSSAELLFDPIVHSTPNLQSDIPDESDGHEEDFGASPKQEAVGSNRKRTSSDSGFLSEVKEGSPAEKKRSEAQTEEIHSASGAAYDEDQAQDLNSVFDSAEEADPPSEEVGLTGGREKAEVTSPTPEVEPQSELTSGISSAFRNFREQLEQHLTSCMKKVEQEVHQSFLKCQQQMSSLLTAVHHQRLLLLKNFEKNVLDQLKKLEENSTHLNQMNAHIKSYFQSELLRLGSFCDHRLNRMKFMDSGFDENVPENVPEEEEKPHTPENMDQ
ncbi:synaptonemal complex protein 2-like isoform X2 [Cynoglossus semilaevis]|uniref:Synaptonemal complex protein 2-like n=1 Tax=Cynoglossus semilaevis TaxID=244447 RepID=A0A3P8WQT5_CYNSE|nr:synaptonemal complex protein 2-like isoform X2 [Cynoglossus semilaevis]